MAQADKITALYCRFSFDDGNGESDSVAHQKTLLREYANNHGFSNQRFYVDDGVSGTTFDRDGFQAMLCDIKNGLVGTVIVKYSSRICILPLKIALHFFSVDLFYGLMYTEYIS